MFVYRAEKLLIYSQVLEFGSLLRENCYSTGLVKQNGLHLILCGQHTNEVWKRIKVTCIFSHFRTFLRLSYLV